jgi:hypothetical protein
MINAGKCPKCEKTITAVSVEDVSLNGGLRVTWKGFSYSCPSCHTVLGVQMNPLTLNSDLVAEMKGRR